MTTKDEEGQTRLARAAEELIKAASREVEETSLQLSRKIVEGLGNLSSTIDSLQRTLQSKFDKNIEKLDENNKVSDENNKKIEAKLDAVVVSLVGVMRAIETQTKQQRIDYALAHVVEHGKFDYLNPQRQRFTSAILVREILESFRKGYGYDIHDYFCEDPYRYVSHAATEEQRKEFREKLSKQIHSLTGSEPRIALWNSKYCIYYS